jgi:hypothetical protein
MDAIRDALQCVSTDLATLKGSRYERKSHCEESIGPQINPLRNKCSGRLSRS